MGWLFPDPPPKSGPRRKLWDEVYETSRDSYERTINGYEEQDARKTATAAVRGWFPSRPKGLRRAPDPQPRRTIAAPINIGEFISFHIVHCDGRIENFGFSEGDHVPLYWSEHLKACLVYPYLTPGECARLPTLQENTIARRWARGRPANCARPVTLPSPPMPRAFPGIAITYDSDKFPGNNGKHTWQRYIHHFGPGVVCYFARSTGRKAPTAMMARGGKLRLETHGLVG